VTYFWILMAIVGLATTMLGFFMLGWKELKAIASGGPYVLFGLLILPFGHHLSLLSGGWAALLYVVGAFSILFGLGVLAFERLTKGWFGGDVLDADVPGLCRGGLHQHCPGHE